MEGIIIGEGSIRELFDLNEKQTDKCLITRTATQDGRFKRIIDRNEAGDVCDDMGTVFFNGHMMRAIQHDRHGMMFLLVDNLKPAAADDEYCTFYALEADGEMLVAVYNGFFCTALMRPMDGSIPDSIQKILRRMADAPMYVPDVPTPAEAAAEEMAEQMGI